MKLELTKETQPNGDMFYNISVDNSHLKAFWIGNYISGDQSCYDGKFGEPAALAEAQEHYNKIKTNPQTEPIIEVIQSETI